MNSLTKDAGFYVLIMYLPNRTSIHFDRKGSCHSFEAGWYAYVGSARGVGGLHSRIARHQRRNADGKRMHWNVDYFREFASLAEVWFTYGKDENTEHNWAVALSELSGASVPVAGFGASDCSSGCPSHFFKLVDRPSTAAFRRQLETARDHCEIFVEFVDEASHGYAKLTPLEREYLLGRRFTEARRRAILDAGDDSVDWTSLAKGRAARQLAEKTAELQGISFETQKAAIEFSSAVDTIVSNCGLTAMEVLFNRRRPQLRNSIMELSRTSDVRQRYRVTGVAAGQFRTVAPHRDDTVFDTVEFAEVPSRLRRARGDLAQVERQLRANSSSGNADIAQLAELCRLAASTLHDRMSSSGHDMDAPPDALSKSRVMRLVRSEGLKGYPIGKARSALRFIVKNVWDYGEMRSRRLSPTEQQKGAVATEILRINATVGRIMELTGGNSVRQSVEPEPANVA